MKLILMSLLFIGTPALAAESKQEKNCLNKLNKIFGQKEKVTDATKIVGAIKSHLDSLSLEKLEVFKMPEVCNQLPGVRSEIAFYRQRVTEDKRLAAGLPVDNAGKFEDTNDLGEPENVRAPASLPTGSGNIPREPFQAETPAGDCRY